MHVPVVSLTSSLGEARDGCLDFLPFFNSGVSCTALAEARNGHREMLGDRPDARGAGTTLHIHHRHENLPWKGKLRLTERPPQR